jgi:hypothetical protein
MKYLLVLIIFISFNSFAQPVKLLAEPTAGTINVEDATNFKSEKIKAIVALPVQETGKESGFFTLAKSLIQFSVGPSFYRFDTFNEDRNSLSAFSRESYYYQLRGQYYFTSWLSIVASYDQQTFEIERYDGLAPEQRDRSQRAVGYGVQIDLGDFIFAAERSNKSLPFFYLDSAENFNEDQIEDVVSKYKFGHRTGVANYIIEFYYFYHNISKNELANLGEITGKAQTLGLEIFTSNRRTFGIKLEESFGEYNYESGQYKFRNLVIQPFFRF